MRVYYVEKEGMGIYEGPFLSHKVAGDFVAGQLESFEHSDEYQTGQEEWPSFTIRPEDVFLDMVDCVDGAYADLGHQIYM